MPRARHWHGAAGGPDGKIYVAGGVSGGGVIASLDVYDPSTDTWTTKAPMPGPRAAFALAYGGNGRLYAVGGVNASWHPVATVEAYDPATDTWSSKASLSANRMYPGLAASSNGKLYVVGGHLNDGLAAAVEEYDPAVNRWTTRANIPTPRVAPGVAAIGGLVYAIGGSYGSTYYNTLEAFDPTTNRWSSRRAMAIRREGPATAASGGRLYVMGGWNNGTAFRDVEEFDPARNTWSAVTALPVTRLAHAAATSGGRLYVTGGMAGAPWAPISESTLFEGTISTAPVPSASPSATRSIPATRTPRPTQTPRAAEPTRTPRSSATPGSGPAPVRSLPAPAQNVQGLAFGRGSLWVSELTGGGSSSVIYEVHPLNGQVRRRFTVPFSATGLTHDGTYLYTTADSGTFLCGGQNPNRIRALDPRTGRTVREIPSPLTGGNGGLAHIGGRLYAVGALHLDPCRQETNLGVVIAGVNPADGALLSHFPVNELGISPRELDGDGINLLYGTLVQDETWPNENFVVYTLSTAGKVLDQRALFSTSRYAPPPSQRDINGLAWGDGHVFLADRSTRTILAYPFPPHRGR